MPVPSSFFHQKYCEDADQVYEDLAAYVERGERGELLYSASGKAEDLRYHDSESGTEVSISAWEFLNEDLKASDDMVLAPSEAVILRSKIKKKSTKNVDVQYVIRTNLFYFLEHLHQTKHSSSNV